MEKNSKKYDRIRNGLKNLLAFYAEHDLNSYSYGGTQCFTPTFRKLEHADREFDADLFFILIFGPLKAGKSTLTNLLAQEYVSPTGFGVETTLRPSIIVKSPTGQASMEIYSMISSDSNRKELFEKVIDILRGIADYEQYSSLIHRTELPLNKSTLVEHLTKPSGTNSEPLITVLKVPGNELLTEHIALIDMPGFDGAQSNYLEDGIHSWLLKRADFLIFVQSSMSALNNTAEFYLDQVYRRGSKRVPLWLVQNIIEAKHWRSESDLHDDNESQLKAAQEQLGRILDSTEAVNSSSVNLGMAEDGCNSKYDRKLYETSKFPEFEQTLQNMMSEHHFSILLENHIRGVRFTVRECRTMFDDYRQTLENEKKQNDSSLSEFETELDKYLQKIRNTAEADSPVFQQAIRGMSDELIKKWDSDCRSLITGLKDQLEKLHASTKDMPALVRKCVSDINDRANVLLSSDTIAGGPLKEIYHTSVKRWNGDTLEMINALLDTRRKKAYYPPVPARPDMPGLKHFLISEQECKRELYKVIYSYLPVMGRAFSLFPRTETGFKEKLPGFIEWFEQKYLDYKDKILAPALTDAAQSVFDTWHQNYIENLEDHISLQKKSYQEEIIGPNGANTLIDSSLRVITQLEQLSTTLSHDIDRIDDTAAGPDYA